MKQFRFALSLRKSTIFKTFLFLVALILIVQVFPKKAKFKYEFQKGKPWQHETLYAPFDFSLKKSDEQITAEKRAIEEKSVVYYKKDTTVFQISQVKFDDRKNQYFRNISQEKKEKLFSKGADFLKFAYQNGVMISSEYVKGSNLTMIQHNNEVCELPIEQVFFLDELNTKIRDFFEENEYANFTDAYYDLFFEVLQPDIKIDQNFTQKALEENLKEIVYTRGWIKQGQLIIAKGEMIEGEKLNALNSLQAEYQSENWNQSNYYWSLLGYYVLVGMVLFLMGLYLRIYERKIFKNNTKISVILFSVLSIILLVSFIAHRFPDYIYLVPVGIIVLILKSFFDLRTVIFVFMVTVLLLGFVAPNSFQFIVIQIIAALTIIITPKGLHYRLNSFVSAALITGTYLITYIAFHFITEGSYQNIDISLLTLFILNGIGILFSQPLTYIYEKVFGLVSDVSLLELSDTNSKLLRELSDKAPGTFQHSMQVANLAEAAAAKIGGNTLLVRVGALYHDIGKMLNPIYFIENQKTSINPHDKLSPLQSAKIIINHVTDGVELARKNKLPKRVIDFIRSHHGTTLTYYFYKKEQELNPDCQEADFRYPGPAPFSKETAILMMADSVEAATKSLKNPTYQMIDEFVDKIIKKQLDENQFANADITLREIEKVKQVFKNKLTNIYHVRIAYPE